MHAYSECCAALFHPYFLCASSHSAACIYLLRRMCLVELNEKTGNGRETDVHLSLLVLGGTDSNPGTFGRSASLMLLVIFGVCFATNACDHSFTEIERTRTKNKKRETDKRGARTSK